MIFLEGVAKNRVKEFGQYFTPKMVAEFMCDLISKDNSVNILEPSAGEGIFLDVLSKRGFKNIKAFEIDSNLRNISSVNIIYQNFLSTNPNEKFHIIIGNPPYVRWRNVSENLKNKLVNDPYWKEKVNGLADLLYSFIYLCVDKLKKNGELIFITPPFWTSTMHSDLLRKYLTEKGMIEYFITFNEMKIFDEVASNILIFKFVKKKDNKPIKVVRVKSKDKLTIDVLQNIKTLLNRLDNEEFIEEDIYEAYQHSQFSNSNPWKPLPPKIEPLINKIEETCTKYAPTVSVNGNKVKLSSLFEKIDLESLNLDKKDFKTVKFADKSYFIRKVDAHNLNNFLNGKSNGAERYIRLGDIAHIGNGMVSGLDSAFKVTDPNQFEETERGKFIPVVKSKNLNRFFAEDMTNYIFVNDVEDENELMNRFPSIFRQLISHKKQLKKRYSYNRNIPWWHWVFLRNKKLIENNLLKIIVPCKERIDVRGYVRFALIEGLYYATQDATVIVKKPEFKEDIKYILALLNSKAIFTWLKHKGLRRGGVLEFSERPLSIIPIRLINWDDEEEVCIYNKIIGLVDKIIETKDIESNFQELDYLVNALYKLDCL